MQQELVQADNRTMTSVFERYLTVWVGLSIVAGILLGRLTPGLATSLDGMSINLNGAPVVLGSEPVASAYSAPMTSKLSLAIRSANRVEAG